MIRFSAGRLRAKRNAVSESGAADHRRRADLQQRPDRNYPDRQCAPSLPSLAAQREPGHSRKKPQSSANRHHRAEPRDLRQDERHDRPRVVVAGSNPAPGSQITLINQLFLTSSFPPLRPTTSVMGRNANYFPVPSAYHSPVMACCSAQTIQRTIHGLGSAQKGQCGPKRPPRSQDCARFRASVVICLEPSSLHGDPTLGRVEPCPRGRES